MRRSQALEPREERKARATCSPVVRASGPVGAGGLQRQLGRGCTFVRDPTHKGTTCMVDSRCWGTAPTTQPAG